MTSKEPSEQLTQDLRDLLRASHLDLRDDAVAELAALVARGKTAGQIYTFLSNLGACAAS
jgi:hypothetical protein